MHGPRFASTKNAVVFNPSHYSSPLRQIIDELGITILVWAAFKVLLIGNGPVARWEEHIVRRRIHDGMLHRV